MSNIYIYIYFAIFTNEYFSISCENLPENWIDPYDMSPSKDYLQYADSFSVLHAHHSDKNTENPANTLSDLYFRRIINMLLNSVYEDYTNPELYSGHLVFEIDAKKYELLKRFADGTSDESLENIDKILGEMLSKPTTEYLQNYIETWFHKCLNIILSREGIIAMIICSYVFVILKLFRSNFYSFQTIQFLFINFFTFDFAFTWIHLYQKATIENLAKRQQFQNIPVQCNPEEMNSWQFLTNIFTSKDVCKDYFEVNMEDIFYKVTPGTVLTEMFARTIQYPAKAIGKAFGDLISGVYDALPWPLNIILLPICLLFICVMTCILLSIVLNRQMKFNFLHLIHFSFGGETLTNRTKDSISGNNLEKLLHITQAQRQFIEVIPVQERNEETKPIEETKEQETKKQLEMIENPEEIGSGDHLESNK